MKGFILYPFLLLFILINYNSYCQGIRKEIDSINSISSEFISSNLDSSLKIFSKNLIQGESIGYKIGMAKSLDKLSFINYLKGRLDKSTEYLQRAVKIYEFQNYFKELSILYGEYGYRLKRYDLKKAKYYMNKGISIARSINYLPALSMLNDNYGVLKEMENDLDSAIYFYKYALRTKKYLKDTVGIPYSFNKLAGVYAIKQEYFKSLRYLDSSDVYRNKEIGGYGRCENLILRGEILFCQGNIDSAIPIFQRCAKISSGLKNTDLTQFCYQQLSLLYEKKNDYKHALEYFKIHIANKDSIVNIRTNQRIAELQTAYETEKKDQRIAGDALEIQKKNNLILILVSLTVPAIIIALWIIRTQKSKRERIESELTLKHQLEKVKFDNKLRSEMLRISRDLHDNIGAQLTFIVSSLDNITYKLRNPELEEKLNSLKTFGKETLIELRNTVWAIKQDEIDFTQLIMKINDLAQRIQNDTSFIKIEVRNSVQEKINLSSTQILNIYRIVQEAFQNILKHAASTEVFIQFSHSEDGLVMLICDNGTGIQLTNLQAGNGLKHIDDRCKEVNGQFSIIGDNSGTKINCNFPIK
jgi:signal transduction histidine kinase